MSDMFFPDGKVRRAWNKRLAHDENKADKANETKWNDKVRFFFFPLYTCISSFFFLKIQNLQTICRDFANNFPMM